MVFSSIPFLYYFLPCALLVYFAAPKRLKNAALLLVSLLFYAWGEPLFVLLMLFSIVQGYGFGLLIQKTSGRPAKAALFLSVTLSLAILACCKYADFFIQGFNAATGLLVPLLHIALPVGISFYTFQIISYTTDVYRGDVPAQRNFIDLAAYIAMFPQLIAGPIVRYRTIAGQLRDRKSSIGACALGIRQFILGLGKKVLLANSLAVLCDAARSSTQQSVLFFWLYAAGFTLQIYFDFSGYSDMALGLGQIFGFTFPANFNYPYIAGSVTEFWRRWHISLGSWFRDYVYIPLGGNRVAGWRCLRNILIVWLLTGLWHGAAWNFLAWGLYFGILLILEKLWLKQYLDRSRLLSHAYLLLVILLGFVLFDARSISDALFTVKAMFGAGGFPAVTTESVYYLKSYAVLLFAAAVGATPLPLYLAGRLQKTKRGGTLLYIAEPLYLLMILCAATGYLVDGSFNPFLYFRF